MARRIVRWTFTLALVLGLAQAAQGQDAQQQHTPGKPFDMSAQCKAMMAEHHKMMAGMKAADERLDQLVTKMNEASGQAKADATAAVVAELVAQRKSMHDRMMQMHHRMMGHTAEHMRAGPQSMAMCPMMKMGAMEH